MNEIDDRRADGTRQRSAAAPARTPAARQAEFARHIADLILHAIAHCGDAAQVYADMVDGRAVALHAAQLLYDEGSDVLLGMRTTHPKATDLADTLSALVGSISQRTVQQRWRDAEALRAADEETERLWAEGNEAQRAADRHAAQRIRDTVNAAARAGVLHGLGNRPAGGLQKV